MPYYSHHHHLIPAMAPPPQQPCLVAPRPSTDTIASDRSTTSTSSIEDAREMLAIMRRLEVSGYFPPDYLHDDEKADGARFRQRRQTVQYLYQIVDFGGFSRDVVHYSVCHILDRYLATESGNEVLDDGNANQFQLTALTSLYMGVKLLEPLNIGVDSLVPLANGVYTREEFLKMEREILTALDWCVGQGPTPLAFVQLFLPLLPLPSTVNVNTLYNHVQYQLELAVSEYFVSRALPSDLAVVALWNALEACDMDLEDLSKCQQTVLSMLEYHDGSEETELLEIRIACLQSKLRDLLLATYSWTASSAAASSAFHIKEDKLQEGPTSTSPVTVVREEADNTDVDDSPTLTYSPPTLINDDEEEEEEEPDLIQFDVSEVDLITF